MKYFLDTEFAERLNTIELLSIGIVAEDGRKFYGINEAFDLNVANGFVREKVFPNIRLKLDVPTVLGDMTVFGNTSHLAHSILTFIGDDTPEFWGYYADYDWVVFCWLFGTMIDLPKGWPMYCRDLKQLADQHNLKLPHQSYVHHALLDALAIKQNYEYVEDWLTAKKHLASTHLPPGFGGSRDHD